MEISDDAVEARAQGWRTLAALHARIDDALERALQREHDLSVSEYGLLDVLSRQNSAAGCYLRMNQVARAVVLSQSATTRLVSRLERRGMLKRYICEDDRRGIYTGVTDQGRAALEQARSTHDVTLAGILADAADQPELAPLVSALAALPFVPARASG